MYRLPFGERYLKFSLPAGLPELDILRGDFSREAEKIDFSGSEEERIAAALENPLRTGLKKEFTGNESIAIAISDLTRPVPSQKLLSVLLPELERRGAVSDNIKLLVGTGMHRKHNEKDFRKLVGREISGNYEVISHDARDNSGLKELGTGSRGTVFSINKHFVEADYRLITGLIDLHQFMGYTGGIKSVAIGLGGAETIAANHELLSADAARPGNYSGNPVRQEIEELKKFLNIDFSLMVLLNEDKDIVKVLAGADDKVHKKGRKLLAESVIREVDGEYDLAVVSPGGYPKDIDLYQSQKALKHCEDIVRPGGTIILAAACREEFGDEKFKKLITKHSNPQSIIADFKSGEFELGAHKAYLYAETLKRCQVRLVTEKKNLEKFCGLPFPAHSNMKKALKATAKEGEIGRGIFIPRASSLLPVRKS